MKSSPGVSIWIDGLPLVESIGTLASLYLLELATVLHQPRVVEITLVVPRSARLPKGFDLDRVHLPVAASQWQRLRREQFWLPGLAAERRADLVLAPMDAVPLRSRVPIAAVGIKRPQADRIGVGGRLRRAIGLAGLRGVPLLWLEDLSDQGLDGERAIALPPFVDNRFRPTAAAADSQVTSAWGLPAEYVLAWGETLRDAHLLLACWTWVEASLGASHVLALLLPDPAYQAPLAELASQLGLEGSVRFLDAPTLDDIPSLMRGARAMLHSGRTLTGQELRWAMACGLPIAAMQTLGASSVVGECAFLTQLDDPRSLGAACLTLLVERDEVARPLRDKGLMRARSYHLQSVLSTWRHALSGLVRFP